MNFDWIVAIVTFLVFTVFSFNYYTGFFVYQADLEMVAGSINQRVLDTIMVDDYFVPVYYNASMTENDRVLYADFLWPEGTEESTKILLNDIEQPCFISGDTIYWQSDLVYGDNKFEMVYSNVSVPMNCDDPLVLDSPLQAKPWSIEKSRAASQGKLAAISAMSYDDYRSSISVSRDIRIELSSGFSYGPEPAANIDVYVFESKTRIAETDEDIEVKVFVW